jgi:hypothetical protein
VKILTKHMKWAPLHVSVSDRQANIRGENITLKDATECHGSVVSIPATYWGRFEINARPEYGILSFFSPSKKYWDNTTTISFQILPISPYMLIPV